MGFGAVERAIFRLSKITVPGTPRPYTNVARAAEIVHTPLVRLGFATRNEGIHTIRRSVARIYFDLLADEGYDAALRATMVLLHHSQSSTTEQYLGISRERAKRDASLTGKPFLSDLVRRRRISVLPREA